MEKVIKSCRGVKKSNYDLNKLAKENQRENFRQLLGFKENELYESKKHSVLKKIRKVFKNQIMHGQHKVSKCYIDLVFPEHKLGIETDENGYTNRSETKEKKRKNNKKSWISNY